MAINISVESQSDFTAGPTATHIDPNTGVGNLANNLFWGANITNSNGEIVKAIKVISGQPVSTTENDAAFTLCWDGTQIVSLNKAQTNPVVLSLNFSSDNIYQEQVIARTNAGQTYYNLVISAKSILNANSLAADLQQIAQSFQITETGSQANPHVSSYNFSLQVSPDGTNWYGAQAGQNNEMNVTWDDMPPTVTQTLFAGTNVFLKFNSTTGSLAAQGDGENTVNPPVSLFTVTANGVVQTIESLTIDQNDHVNLVLAKALLNDANVVVSYNAPPQSYTGVLESADSMNNVASFTTTASYAAPAPVTITVGNSEVPLDFAGPLPLLSLNKYQGSPNTFTLNSYDAKSGDATVTAKQDIIANPLYQAGANAGLTSEHYVLFYSVVKVNVIQSQLNISSIFPQGVNSTISSADFKAQAPLFNYVGTSFTSGVTGSVDGVSLDNNNYIFYTLSSPAGIYLNADAKLPAAGGLWGAETISGNTSVNEQFMAGMANSTITGGSGSNTVVFTNNFADYDFKYTGSNTYSVTNISTTVVNTLTNIQRLVFSDRIISPVGINVALAASAQADVNVDGFTVYDTAANITSNLSSLQLDTKLASITQSDSPTFLSVSATRSFNDHGVLAKISGHYNLKVAGQASADKLFDTVNSHATLIGGAGADTFKVTGRDIITDLGKGGSDVLNVEDSGFVIARAKVDWIASPSTVNNGEVIIKTPGLMVNLSKVQTGTHGFHVVNTGDTAKLTGSGLGDKLIGSDANDILIGRAGKDILIGGIGSDRLIGGLGNDILTGGEGKDYFVFNTTPNSKNNIDTVTDFVSGTDKLQFSKTIFSALTTGVGTGNGKTLPTSEFVSDPIATQGTTATSHLIYNSSSGGLYYDADGNGSGAAVEVAILGTVTHPALVASDFLVIP